jgi:hypothetical protein
LAALSPLLNQNTTLKNAVMNITLNPNLDMNSQFVPLFNYILSNSTIYSQTITNFSTIIALKWAQTMSQESVRIFLLNLMNSSLSVFYHLMIDNTYLNNEENCQQLFQAVIATKHQEAIDSILAPITGQYFWNKRCILSQTDLVSVA